MSAAERVVEIFERLNVLDEAAREKLPRPEQVLYYVVAARCQIDIGGFGSLFEQLLTENGLSKLTDGLRAIDEEELARVFQTGLDLLKTEKFYKHLDWKSVPKHVRQRIDGMGKEVGDRLWGLDEKLIEFVEVKRKKRT